MAPVAPVSSVVCGSGSSSSIGRSWLQFPVSVVVCVSSCQYWLFRPVVPVVSPVVMAPMAPVAICHSLPWLVRQWLQYYLLSSLPVAPSCRSLLLWLLSLVAAPVSSVVRSWLQWLVQAVARGSSLQWYLSLVAPVAVVHGSSLQCLLLLRYLSFVAPVSPVVSSCGSCGSSNGSSTIYCHFLWLQAVSRCSCGCRRCLSCSSFSRQPSSVLVIFL